MFSFRPKAGYPQRYYDELRRAARIAAFLFAVTGTFALITTGATVFLNGSLILAAVALAVFLLFGLLGGLMGLYDTWRHVRVIPYFPRTVGEIETFLAGEALARNLAQLDAIAREAGATPLSDFGFNDDLFREPLTWHPAARGVDTVEILQSSLQTTSEVVHDRQAVLADLQKLKHALNRAADLDIPFCLLLRHGNSTSGQEWDVRQGTAF